jgi:methionyl-tRNA formyltransferase
VRAFHPWPIAFTPWRGEELRIHAAWPLDIESGQPPGTVLPPSRLPPAAGDPEEAFAVQTGRGALAIRRLQRPGRREVTSSEFLRGQRDFVGQRLGDRQK